MYPNTSCRQKLDDASGHSRRDAVFAASAVAPEEPILDATRRDATEGSSSQAVPRRLGLSRAPPRDATLLLEGDNHVATMVE
mmetsp:Transcript_8648/g.27167  ORF Transcript_8648/g.27167 Transcript_8648/m.27167 type:complete len:82 (+) Transcript_8648:220-465(+)